MNCDEILYKLSKSKFRSSFHLRRYMLNYINEKGLDKIKEHAYDFIRKRLAPDIIPNDGKQTPMKGHPVFIAQHATATCCRGCLEKWHHIPKGRMLSEKEIDYIVNLIMLWINEETNHS
jgi:exodeoxyribonuclease V alpha subunit